MDCVMLSYPFKGKCALSVSYKRKSNLILEVLYTTDLLIIPVKNKIREQRVDIENHFTVNTVNYTMH